MADPRINYLGQNIDQPNPLYEAHSQRSSRPREGTQPQFDLNAMMMAFLMQQQQQNQDRIALQRDRSFGRQLGWGGAGGLTPQAKWDEMFPSHDERIGREVRMTGDYGLTGVQEGLAPKTVNPARPRPEIGRQVADPFDEMGNPLPGVDFGSPLGSPISMPAPAAHPTRMLPGGGFEGMINPQLQGNAKFSDANTYTGKVGKSTKPRRRGSSFQFGAGAAPGFSM